MRKMLLATLLVAVAAGSAWAFTIATSQTQAGGQPAGVKDFNFDVTVEEGDEPLRDFHLVLIDGRRQHLVGTMMTPVVTSTDPDLALSGWDAIPNANGTIPNTADNVGWRTTDEEAGEGGTSEASDPVTAGHTVRFVIRSPRAGRYRIRDVRAFPTTDGTTTPPGGNPPPGFTPLPAPVTATTAEPSDATPAPNTTQPMTATCCVPAQQYEVYLAKSLSSGSGTDPLGIGINTLDPIPQQWGVAVTPSAGVMSSPDEDTYPSASMSLSVGGAPLGSKFYLVVVSKEGSEFHTWSEPVEFEVTAP